jgi:ABC-2 type transport system ATP-binding protein
MAPSAAAGERAARAALDRARIEVTGTRVAQPTLENAFVKALRDMGGEIYAPPFPFRGAPHARDVEAPAIRAARLTKRFGAFEAVRGVDVRVGYGEIYGLLGANGAGKTTTIKMLCGLLEPTAGEVALAGSAGSLRSSDVRRRVGYMSQKFSLYDDLTISENLDFFAGVYGVPRGERAEKKRWVLSLAGLERRGDLMTAALPGGWKQRVAFGAAVMHEPEVLFLDEPTSGVDPLARRALWKMINRLADRGVAVLVTTHYLEEAEQCNRLGFMVAGEVVAEGTPSGIKAAQGGRLLEARVDQPQRALELLKRHYERWRVALFGDRLHLIVDDGVEEGVATLRRLLADGGVVLESAREEPYSLEDVFIAVVERSRREGAFVED